MRNIACKKKTLNFTTEEIKERKAHALIKKLGKYSGCSLLNWDLKVDSNKRAALKINFIFFI